MSDVRDVFFQLDPFEALRPGKGLGSTLGVAVEPAHTRVMTWLGVAVEPAHLTIGECEIHARWLSDECGSYKNEGIFF